MSPLDQRWFTRADRRAALRATDCNPHAPQWIRAVFARYIKSFKTNPIVSSFPKGPARCAFARSGAQRAPKQKSGECKILSSRCPPTSDGDLAPMQARETPRLARTITPMPGKQRPFVLYPANAKPKLDPELFRNP